MSGVLGDKILLPDSTTVGDEEKLCNRSFYRFKLAEDTSEGPLQDYAPVLMAPK